MNDLMIIIIMAVSHIYNNGCIITMEFLVSSTVSVVLFCDTGHHQHFHACMVLCLRPGGVVDGYSHDFHSECISTYLSIYEDVFVCASMHVHVCL